MDEWYAKLKDRYGEEYCRLAGYFDETKPYRPDSYACLFLPERREVIQFSGAFYPFHDGHGASLEAAVRHVRARGIDPFVVIHVDHAEYRKAKAKWACQDFRMGTLDVVHRVARRMALPERDIFVLFEDDLPESCSRNFSRLYMELARINHRVWFLSGGDRANYALTFRDEGRCIISGRDTSPMYQKYRYLADDERIVFLDGNHPLSSTIVRKEHPQGYGY